MADDPRLTYERKEAQKRANATGEPQTIYNGEVIRPTKQANGDGKKDEAAAPAPMAPTAPVTAAPTYTEKTYTAVNPSVAAGAEAQAISAGAANQMAASDAYTQGILGESGADALQKAQAAAAQTAQSQSDAAVQQALKAAKTSGAMGGQAALVATGQAANAYAQAQQAAQQQYFNLANLSQAQGQNMANRLAQTASDAQTRYQTAVNENLQKFQTETGAQQAKYGTDVGAQQSTYSTQMGQYATDVNAATQKYSTDVQKKITGDQQKIDLFSKGLGAIGAMAGLFSDKNKKEYIKRESLTKGLDSLKGYSYKYKKGPGYSGGKKEVGIMAQDLEKTKLAPAVIDTPEGKMIDTRRLSTMNTAIVADHEKRMKDIEAIIEAMRNEKKPEAKK